MEELDRDKSNSIEKDEFVNIIEMVFEKMVENEIELIQTITKTNPENE
jgi:hypothetical protein